MTKGVLIVYGSRYGCTEEVSHEIGKILEKNGLSVSLVNLELNKNTPNIEEFDAILVGSGIKIGKWTKETDNFLKKNKDSLNSKVLGLYTCSGLAIEDVDKAKKTYIEDKMEKIGIGKLQLGKQGVTDNFIYTINNMFNTHRNVKISVLKSARGEGKEGKTKVKSIADELLEKLGKNYTAKIIGFTIIIKKWRKPQR